MFLENTVFNGDIDISSWNLSSATDITGMFKSTYFNGDIGSWDVSGVKNMKEMFRGDVSFNQDISDWNTSNVTDMTQMFYGAKSFYQDISGWIVDSVGSTLYDQFSTNSAIDSNSNYLPAKFR
tara:strand:+ start:231 stop:599 length:369 start_codon:yes stop_codon:yes gene_type:complete